MARKNRAVDLELAEPGDDRRHSLLPDRRVLPESVRAHPQLARLPPKFGGALAQILLVLDERAVAHLGEQRGLLFGHAVIQCCPVFPDLACNNHVYNGLSSDVWWPNPNAAFDVVAIAASAGGLRALTKLLSALTPDFPASIAVVQHLDPRHRSLMADILSRHSRLPIKQADDGDRVRPGAVFIAPPDRHLLVNADGSLSISRTELVHFLRPSADLLFESVAASFKDRAIAVVLTGTGSDGARGLQAIKKMGGTVIAQDEGTSEFFGMPSAAINTGDVDFVLPLNDIASALTTLIVRGDAA